jgi:Aspartyl/Asparaginyl beta-hydroxylase
MEAKEKKRRDMVEISDFSYCVLILQCLARDANRNRRSCVGDMRVRHRLVLSAALLVCVLARVGGAAELEQKEGSSPVVEDALWEKAIAYVQNKEKNEPSDTVISLLESKDIRTIHQVAKHMIKNEKNNKQQSPGAVTLLGVEILHALADDETAPHVPSLLSLGFYYAKQQKLIRKAVRYFELAGNLGPHQAALYNAGRLHSDLKEYVHAMAYIREAARFPETHPLLAQDEALTETCREAYQLLCQQLLLSRHALFVTADLFFYGNLHHDLTSKQQVWWKTAIEAMSKFDNTLIASSGEEHNVEFMETTINNLRMLWEKSNSGPEDERLSPFQAYLLLEYITYVLDLMTIQNEAFASASAGYEEALARSPFCYSASARSEDEDTELSCFNGAASRAVVYYNRAGDAASAQRVFDLARQHPTAATKWERLNQTPRVYHLDDNLQARQPFWKDTSIFPTAIALEKLYKTKKGNILAELNAVKDLPEGFQLTAASLLANNVGGEAEVKADGSVVDKARKLTTFGFLRIFNPQIGVRSDDKVHNRGGAGAWAEFGPLYDGRRWSKAKCQVVPTICKAIQKNDKNLCIRKNDIAKGLTVVEEQAVVARACGTPEKASVVSLLRLRPGSRILPHVGTTNARLLLHLCLEGCRGVEITVGDVTVKKDQSDGSDGGAGAAIIFDDSFVYTMYNRGAEDAIFLQVVMTHPRATKNMNK